jgi:hypothetical protein
MDGRQDERRLIYEQEAGAAVVPEQVEEQFMTADLYPHGPLVIGEGESERIIIDALVWVMQAAPTPSDSMISKATGALPGAQPVRATPPVRLGGLHRRHNEGRTAEHIATIPEATLPKENVLLASGSLEEDNFDAPELIGAACHLAATPPEGRTAVALTLTAETLLASHADRCSRVSGKPPDIADTLISMTRNPEYGNVSKPELAEEIARRVALRCMPSTVRMRLAPSAGSSRSFASSPKD